MFRLALNNANDYVYNVNACGSLLHMLIMFYNFSFYLNSQWIGFSSIECDCP